MRRICISMALLLAAAVISVEIGCSSEYQTVTFSELTSNMTAYDGQKILIRGKYVEGPWAIPECEPTGTGENPQIKEGYAYCERGRWSIANPDGYGLLGVAVIDDDGRYHSSTKLDYERGQEIELRGIARATTFQDPCDRDIRYETIYIEVKGKDLGITFEPPPEPPPEEY